MNKKRNEKKILDSRFWFLDSRSGQSLVEAMIALALLTTGFLGLVALLSKSFFLNRVVSDTTTANYLAAEGIELAKNLIDHDVYDHIVGVGTGWGTCFLGNGGNSTDVEIDYTTTDCGNLTTFVLPGHPLLFNASNNTYSYNAPGTPTHFTREIRVKENPDKSITVDSIVRWSSGSVTNQSVDLEDVFYDWQE